MGRWLKSRLVLAASAAPLLSSILVPGAVSAQNPTAAQTEAAAMATTTVVACYVPTTGTMYRIGEPGLATNCFAPNHVRMEWSSGGESGNTPGSVVERDANGGFTAGAVSLTSLSVSGSTSLGGGMVRVNDDGGLLALGPTTRTDDSGSPLGVSGQGARMFWYPRIQAFRAGFARDAEWDEEKLGDQSAAFGLRTEATGHRSFAVGDHAVASGEASLAAGIDSEASGDYSVALGMLTTASGTGGTALGDRTVASGGASTALNQGTEAGGWASLAAGKGSKATGEISVALGNNARAEGMSSFAGGSMSTASGRAAVALGYQATASGDGSTAMGTLTTAGGEVSTAMGFKATAAHSGSFAYGDDSAPNLDPITTTADNQFVVRAQHIWLGQDNSVTAAPVNFLDTSTGAFLTTGGAWTNSSDEARKHLFEEADPEWALARLASMPVREWSYKAEEAAVRHLGPTAQDFHAAFGLGGTDKAISTVDADGVALLSIKALERRTRELEAENTELRRRLDALEAALLGGRR